METLRVFRIPEGMTGAQMAKWIAPELLHLITGPPFDPEAWAVMNEENEFDKVLDKTVNMMQGYINGEQTPEGSTDGNA